MKNFVLLFLLVAYTATPGFTQTKNTGSVRGKVTDSTGNQSLKDATVSVLDAGDSSVVVFGLSKEDGTFFIENVPFGNNILLVTYQGFGELEKLFTLSAEKPEFNAGSIRLASLPADLGNVTVKTSPIVVKGDTTEFNASSFKTKPNSTAEDLLKKLPGVEVEKDGSIKAQGQTVTRVMVDGKRFFGDDPTLATRNIPTDMIDKIQVVDGQSDQSAFSGFDDGNRQMTINITTKKDRRKGLFGKAALGVGNDDLAFKNETRYAANTNISYFNGDRRISVVAQANNNNGQNFSSQDILGTGGGRGGGNFGGGGGNFGGGFNTGPTGFTTTRMGGLNYSDIWSPKTNMSASYFYNNQNRINRQDRLRETLVTGDSSRFTTTNSFSDNKNSNNRFNFEIEHRFDTMNSITIRPTFNQQQTDNISNSTSFTTKGKLSPVNDVTRTTRTETKGYNFNNTILYRHRFAKRGRSMSLNLTQGLNTNEGNTKTLSYNNSYTNGSIRRDTTNQISINDRESKSYGASLSYVEPISTKGKLELNYRYNYSQSNSDRNAMMFNVNTNKYDINNIQLSNTFESINTVNQASLNYQRQINQLFNYTVGLGVQHSEVSNDNKTKKTYLKQAFNNFTPTFSLVYRKDRSMNIRFNYTGSTQQPDVTLLQDVINNINPLNITTGNPNLKQEFSNRVTLTLSKNNRVTNHNMQVFLNASMTSNRIGNEIFQNNTNSTIVLANNETLIRNAQFSRPVNLNGGYNMNGSFNYSFPLKNPKSNINLSTNVNYGRDVNLINSITSATAVGETAPSFTNNYTIGQTVRYNMNLKEQLDLNFSSRSTYNFARYNEQGKSVSTRTNADYFTEVISFEPTYSTKKGFIISNDLDYNLSRGQAEGYNQSFTMWNASVAQQLFKKKQGEVRLTVFDLLNQNRSITRTVQANYIEDTRTDVLKRYFMITFTYNIRKFGGGNQGGQQRQFQNGGMRLGGDRQMRINN